MKPTALGIFGVVLGLYSLSGVLGSVRESDCCIFSRDGEDIESRQRVCGIAMYD